MWKITFVKKEATEKHVQFILSETKQPDGKDTIDSTGGGSKL